MEIHGQANPIHDATLEAMRRELFARAIRPDHLSDFMDAANRRTKPQKYGPNLCSTLFAATA